MTKRKNIISRLNKVDYSIFVICSILSVYMFVLFYQDLNSFSIKQNESPVATITYKQNTVQRKFSNRNIWEKVTSSCSVYDGDSIRTANASEAKAEFLQSEVKINLNENSMIQIYQNKKKDVIDFIGGEIKIENNSVEKPVVIHAGTKEISISNSSKAKLTAVEPKTEDEAPKEAVIEVESGHVEISEIEVSKKDKKDEESVPITVTAGNTFELELTKNISEQKIEQIEEPIPEPETIVEEPEEIIEQNELIEEPTPKEVKEPVVEPVKEQVVEKAIEKPVEKEPVIIKEIPAGETFKKNVFSALFKKNYWDRANGKYNYEYGLPLSELIPGGQKISKGSVLEITLSGNPNKKMTNVAIQISTGEDEWKGANEYKILYLKTGGVVQAGENFESKTVITIIEDIVNTSKSYVAFAYDSNVLDEQTIVTDFNISAKILTKSVQITPVNKNLSKTIDIGDTNWIQTEYYKENKKTPTINYHLYFDPSSIFGCSKTIKAGTKFKLTLSGTSTLSLDFINVEIINKGGEWKNLVIDEKGEYPNILGKRVEKGKPFTSSIILVMNEDLINTDSAEFAFATEYSKKEVVQFSDCKLTIELIE